MARKGRYRCEKITTLMIKKNFSTQFDLVAACNVTVTVRIIWFIWRQSQPAWSGTYLEPGHLLWRRQVDACQQCLSVLYRTDLLSIINIYMQLTIITRFSVTRIRIQHNTDVVTILCSVLQGCWYRRNIFNKSPIKYFVRHQIFNCWWEKQNKCRSWFLCHFPWHK